MAFQSPTGRISVTVTIAMALVSANLASAQTAPAAIGVAASIVGDVKISNAAAPKAKPVKKQQRIAMADLVQTGKSSQLQILLLDRSTFSIGANASLRIDRFVYDPAKGRSVGATAVKGAFRFMSGRPNSANRATINSPVATIGVRGTFVDGAVGQLAQEIIKGEAKSVRGLKSDKQTATLVVLRGPGPRVAASEPVGAASVSANGVTVELTEPMQASFVPKAGAAPVLFRITPAGLARLQDQITPRLAPKKSDGGLLAGLLGVAAAGVLSGSGDRQRSPQQTPQDAPPTTSNYPYPQ